MTAKEATTTDTKAARAPDTMTTEIQARVIMDMGNLTTTQASAK